MNDGEKWARRFHESYERLAPDYGYETRTETREFNPQSANGKLMRAVVSDVLHDFYDEHCRDYDAYDARLAEAERDAKRYRWLRNNATTGDWCDLGGLPAAMMEAEVDKAIAASETVAAGEGER